MNVRGEISRIGPIDNNFDGQDPDGSANRTLLRSGDGPYDAVERMIGEIMGPRLIVL